MPSRVSVCISVSLSLSSENYDEGKLIESQTRLIVEAIVYIVSSCHDCTSRRSILTHCHPVCARKVTLTDLWWQSTYKASNLQHISFAQDGFHHYHRNFHEKSRRRRSSTSEMLACQYPPCRRVHGYDRTGLSNYHAIIQTEPPPPVVVTSMRSHSQERGTGRAPTHP